MADEVLHYMGWRLDYSTGTIQLNTINEWLPRYHHLLLYLDKSDGTEISTLKPIERLIIINGENQNIGNSEIKIFENGDETDIIDIPMSTGTTLKLTISNSRFITTSNVKFRLYGDSHYISPGYNYYTANEYDDKFVKK